MTQSASDPSVLSHSNTEFMFSNPKGAPKPRIEKRQRTLPEKLPTLADVFRPPGFFATLLILKKLLTVYHARRQVREYLPAETAAQQGSLVTGSRIG